MRVKKSRNIRATSVSDLSPRAVALVAAARKAWDAPSDISAIEAIREIGEALKKFNEENNE